MFKVITLTRPGARDVDGSSPADAGVWTIVRSAASISASAVHSAQPEVAPGRADRLDLRERHQPSTGDRADRPGQAGAKDALGSMAFRPRGSVRFAAGPRASPR